MNSMFSSFTNFETTYQPNPFQPTYPRQEANCKVQGVNMNKPYEVKNLDGSIKGYFWYYGNSVDLVFEISEAQNFGEDSLNQDVAVTLLDQDQYITTQDALINVMQELQARIVIYNFRMEPILEFSNNIDSENKLIIDPSKEIISIQITNALSSKLVRGKYHLTLEVSNLDGYHETLFSADTCIFEVR